MKFPYKVHSGSVFVTVYREKRKGGYTTYLLRWKQGGEVKKEAKNDLDEALKRAKEVADLIAEGRAEMTDITALQREIYADLEKKIQHTGLTLTQVVERFVESWEPDVSEVTVKKAFESYLAAKAGLGARHQKDIKQRIGALSSVFGDKLVSALREDELRKFIESRSNEPRTRNNYLSQTKSFLNFCKQEKYIKRKVPHVLDFVKAYRLKGQADDHLMPAGDLARIIEAVTMRDDEEANLITIACLAFAGVRVNEFKRLTWGDLIWENGVPAVLNIGANKAKTLTRRSIPLNESFKAIFTRVQRKETGPLTPYDAPERVIQKIAKRLEIKWDQNCLRHTYITHELAYSQDHAKVAYLAGNSPQMIQRHYRGLSKESNDAKAWFGVAFNLPPSFMLRQRYSQLKGTPPPQDIVIDPNDLEDLAEDPSEAAETNTA